MKWMIGGVLAAWAAIVWLAWTLADRRMVGTCYQQVRGIGCDIGAIAVRDWILVAGFAVPLILFVALALAGVLRLNRRQQSASRELEPRDPR